jgi:hypothetical protein
VADRWHRWHNLAGHAGKTVARHRSCLQEPSPGDGAGPPGAERETAKDEQEPAGPGIAHMPADEPAGEGRLAARTRERY